jgi:hypothetical protein
MPLFLAIKPCFAAGCPVKIARRLLMCPKHWRMVPRDIQIAVYETLDAWQRGGDPKPYIKAIEAARAAVAQPKRGEQ